VQRQFSLRFNTFIYILAYVFLAVVVLLVEIILRCLNECKKCYASLCDEIVQDDPRRKGN